MGQIYDKPDKGFHPSKRFNKKNPIILVDIDETICRYEGERKYDEAIPIQENIDLINSLYDSGCKVIMWTARGGSEASKKAGRCYHDFTQKQLEGWGLKFTELSTGSHGNYIKPAIDLVIDDKAMTIDQLRASSEFLCMSKSRVNQDKLQDYDDKDFDRWSVR